MMIMVMVVVSLGSAAAIGSWLALRFREVLRRRRQGARRTLFAGEFGIGLGFDCGPTHATEFVAAAIAVTAGGTDANDRRSNGMGLGQTAGQVMRQVGGSVFRVGFGGQALRGLERGGDGIGRGRVHHR